MFAWHRGVTEMRAPHVRGLMRDERRTIETGSAADLGVDLGAAAVTIDAHSPPAEKPQGQKFEGADSVSAVVGKLRDEANVI